jgi:hypothetical protein
VVGGWWLVVGGGGGGWWCRSGGGGWLGEGAGDGGVAGSSGCCCCCGGWCASERVASGRVGGGFLFLPEGFRGRPVEAGGDDEARRGLRALCVWVKRVGGRRIRVVA